MPDSEMMRIVEFGPMAEPEESVVSHYAKGTLGAVLTLALVAAAWTARSILILVLVALVLAIGLDPGVRWLHSKLKMKRGLAVTLIILGSISSMVIFLVLVIPPIVAEVQLLARRGPEYIRNLRSSGGALADLEQRFQLSKRLQDLSKDVPKWASASVGTIFNFTKSLAGGIFSGLTLLVLTLYFMTSLPKLEDGISALFPAERRIRYREVLDDATERIGGYVSGNLIISLIAGVVSFIGFLIIGVPFPAVLAVVVAFTDLIPSVGALIGAVICVAVAAFRGTSTAVITFAYLMIYQQVENYVISPRVMKKAVDLSPAAVVISVLIGGSLLGFVGALLALPIAAAAKVVVRDLWLADRIEGVREGRAGP
jgi:predicted PurR-regulated permease PerM